MKIAQEEEMKVKRETIKTTKEVNMCKLKKVCHPWNVGHYTATSSLLVYK